MIRNHMVKVKFHSGILVSWTRVSHIAKWLTNLISRTMFSFEIVHYFCVWNVRVLYNTLHNFGIPREFMPIQAFVTYALTHWGDEYMC